jgi:hypothetical protein
MVTGQRTGSCLAAWMLLLMLSAAARTTTAQTARASKSPAVQPRVFLLDGASLVRIKNAEASDPRKQQVLQAVSSAAEKAMHEGPFSVMQKAVVPPSGDKHDYMSQAPYFWEDRANRMDCRIFGGTGSETPSSKRFLTTITWADWEKTHAIWRWPST